MSATDEWFHDPLKLSIIFGVLMMFAAMSAVWTVRVYRKYREHVDGWFSQLLASRGWTRSAEMPQRTLAALDENTFLIPASSSSLGYTCTHEFRLNDASIHIGLIAPAGAISARVRRDAVVLACGDLIAPAACMIAREKHPRMLGQQANAFVKTATGSMFCLHFAGRHEQNTPELCTTIRIAELLLDQCEEMFTGRVVAQLGRGGLVIGGIELRGHFTDDPNVLAFVRGAERLLNVVSQVRELNEPGAQATRA